MSILFEILAFIGYIIMFVGAIWILVIAFKKSVAWGLCSLFIPFVIFVFTFMNWKETKKPFYIWLLGFIVAIIFMILMAVMRAH